MKITSLSLLFFALSSYASSELSSYYREKNVTLLFVWIREHWWAISSKNNPHILSEESRFFCIHFFLQKKTLQLASMSFFQRRWHYQSSSALSFLWTCRFFFIIMIWKSTLIYCLQVPSTFWNFGGIRFVRTCLWKNNNMWLLLVVKCIKYEFIMHI